MKAILATLLLLISTSASALEISTMFEVMEDNRAQFTVKNTTQHRIYLHVGVSKLDIIEGEITKTPYTRNNIEQWEISVRPAKTIIEPGFEKTLEVNYHCKVACENNMDKMFQLSVVPTPYFPEGKPNKNAVQMAIGFAPIVAVVDQAQAPEHQIRHLGKYIEFTNLGQSLFNVTMQSCDDEQVCRAQAKVLAGRTLRYALPENLQEQDLSLTLTSAFGEHEQKVMLAYSNGEAQ